MEGTKGQNDMVRNIVIMLVHGHKGSRMRSRESQVVKCREQGQFSELRGPGCREGQNFF